MEASNNQNVVPIGKHADKAIEAIDKGLEEAQDIPIEQALQAAIDGGWMEIKEAEQCKEAYY